MNGQGPARYVTGDKYADWDYRKFNQSINAPSFVAIPYGVKETCDIEPIRRSEETYHRWELIAKHDREQWFKTEQKRLEHKIIRDAEEKRLDAQLIERIRATWKETQEAKRKSKKGADLLDDGKQLFQKAKVKKTQKQKSRKKLNIKLNFNEAIGMLKRRKLDTSPDMIHQSLVNMYYVNKMIPYGAKVAVGFDGVSFTITEH